MHEINRRTLLQTLMQSGLATLGTVVLARATLGDENPSSGQAPSDVQARADRLRTETPSDSDEPETFLTGRAFRNSAFGNAGSGGFRNGGFANGGGGGGAFRNGGFANTPGPGGFANGGFVNGGGGGAGFRNGGFANGGGGGGAFRNGAFRN